MPVRSFFPTRIWAATLPAGRSDALNERLLREWGELGYSDEIMEQVFHGNAERVLGV